MQTAFIAQSLVLTLGVMVTLLLWLNYRNSRKTYLALATAAGVFEIFRLFTDFLILNQPETLPLYPVSGLLQLLSSLMFLYQGALISAMV